MRGGFLALTAVLALAACASAPSPAQKPVAVTTTQAVYHRFVDAGVFAGMLVARRSVVVGANVTGRLSSAPFQVGDRVQAGQVLAAIDATSYSASLSQARGANEAAVAQVNAARAALAQASAQERLAAATAQRNASLYQTGDVSRQRFDETQAALQTARAAVAQAQASVASASGSASQSTAAIDVARVPVQDSVITAPFSGIVTQKFAEAGAVVTPGSSIAALEDADTLEADVTVPEDLAAALRPGQIVQMRVDATGERIEGRIRAIVPAQNAQLHTAQLRIAVNSGGGKVFRGMFVRAEIPSPAQQRIAVPSAALVTRAGQTGVFAVRNDRVEFIPVQTAQSAGTWTAVSGLSPGTTLVLRGTERLDDGTAITVQR